MAETAKCTIIHQLFMSTLQYILYYVDGTAICEEEGRVQNIGGRLSLLGIPVPMYYQRWAIVWTSNTSRVVFQQATIYEPLYYSCYVIMGQSYVKRTLVCIG